MVQLTLEQLQERLTQTEEQLRVQIDRVYGLVTEKTTDETLENEFRAVVQRMTEKYFLLCAILDAEKSSFDQEEYEERTQLLSDQYKQDLSTLAVSLDKARDKESRN